jgi:hypothetical protein
MAPLYQYISKVRTKADTPRAQLNHWRRSSLRLNFLIRRILCAVLYVQLILHNGVVTTVCRDSLARHVLYNSGVSLAVRFKLQVTVYDIFN